MPMIRFTKNWNNKLDCDFFTTIRRNSGYHNRFVGREYSVYLKGKEYCRAELIEAIPVPMVGSAFDPGMRLLLSQDTGATWEEASKILKSKGTSLNDAVVLLFKRLDNSSCKHRWKNLQIMEITSGYWTIQECERCRKLRRIYSKSLDHIDLFVEEKPKEMRRIL